MVKLSEFSLEELFKIEKTKGFNKNELKLNKSGEYDYITRTSLNNGIESKTDKIPSRVINPPNTYSLGLLQMTFFYRERPWYAGQFVRKITPKFKASPEVMLYFLTYFKKISKVLLGVLVRDVDKTFENLVITLPVTSNDQLDFEYMEKQIKKIEMERIKELEAYLKVSGLKDLKLTQEEKEIIGGVNRSSIYQEFSLGSSYIKRGKEIKVSEQGIFQIMPTKKKINANQVSFAGHYPYVARGSSNNGIRGKIDSSISYLNPANTISFGQDTGTMYFQSQPYFTGDKIQVFKLNPNFNHELNEEVGLYLIGVAQKIFSTFSWGTSSFAIDRISSLKIKLPYDTKTGNPDFDYIEKYVQVMKKVIVKNINFEAIIETSDK